MKAMLLAAGAGNRLRPLTDTTAKPMLAIAGRPVLEHNVRWLARYGVREIIINLHHRPEVIRSHFGDGSSLGVDITYSHEPALLGTSGAVKKVRDQLGDPFLIVYGDNLTTLNIHKLLATHRRSGGIGTIALFERDNPLASGIVETDGRGRILRFLEKPSASEIFSRWVNAGVLAWEPEVLDHIPDGFSDFGRDVFPALLQKSIPLYGYRMSEGLWWMDTLEDYNRLKELADNGKVKLE